MAIGELFLPAVTGSMYATILRLSAGRGYLPEPVAAASWAGG